MRKILVVFIVLFISVFAMSCDKVKEVIPQTNTRNDIANPTPQNTNQEDYSHHEWELTGVDNSRLNGEKLTPINVALEFEAAARAVIEIESMGLNASDFMTRCAWLYEPNYDQHEGDPLKDNHIDAKLRLKYPNVFLDRKFVEDYKFAQRQVIKRLKSLIDEQFELKLKNPM